VVDHGDKEIEEELATVLHLALHGTATLECVARSDDECEVVCTKLRIVVGCVGVCKASRREDRRALDARLKALLSQGELLQFLEAVMVGLTVYDGVLEDRTGSGVDNSFAGAVASIFKAPAVTLLAIFHAWSVVAFVEVLENG
jgi:hypothetical protein